MRNTTGHIESIINVKRIITAGIERLIERVEEVKVRLLIGVKLKGAGIKKKIDQPR